MRRQGWASPHGCGDWPLLPEAAKGYIGRDDRAGRQDKRRMDTFWFWTVALALSVAVGRKLLQLLLH